MTLVLPLRAHLDWLKKASKSRLEQLRASNASATLSDAQLSIARDYGFSSWRALKAEIDRRRAAFGALETAIAADTTPIASDDTQLLQLHKAVREGDVPAVVALLKSRPALVNAKDRDGQASLHVAAEWNDVKLGALLFASGADIEMTFGDSGHTALSWAITCNSLDFARAITALGARADLFCAAGMGDVDGIRAAFDDRGQLKPGASRTGSSRYSDDGLRLPCPPTSARDQISDALYAASRNGRADAVRELLTHDPDLGFRAYSGGTSLHWAHFSGARDVIDMLIAAGADTTRHDNTMNASPRAFGICTAASWGFGWKVKMLLRNDPTLKDVRTADRKSAADQARAAGHAALADELDRGA